MGLRRNVKKGQWEPVRLIEHLGLKRDLQKGQFQATQRRAHKCHAKKQKLPCDAARKSEVAASEDCGSLYQPVPAFTCRCQSRYQAVPVARLQA
ncbi:hypothetical protein CYMTET_35211 [Cymbomonas tetramitiformis]|uniref:Uncharacterized protein n=1 Tax=Cymbomonas tetramitiformis TaxID=36881 RepID=A0AAE0F9Q5_9CHLO|nr:hypothetical protein CYMTET_35211 [Cymbomonas tetramitiformis]